MLGVITFAAYLVTLLVGVPAWVAVNTFRRLTLAETTSLGAGLGVAVGLVARLTTVPEWPLGLLLWSGGIGGALAAAVFQVVAGPLPDRVSNHRQTNA
jgi:hypothetical protein